MESNSAPRKASGQAQENAPESTGSDVKGAVAASALVFAMGTMLSRILGLLRDMLTARYLPPDVRDAFIVAFRLPFFFRRILGEGAISVSFIPVFMDVLAWRAPRDEKDQRARELVSGVFSILLTLTLIISALAIVFMEDILGWLLTGQAYRSVPGKFEMTVEIGRIMFGFLVLISMYAYFMAVLQALKKFALAAVAPCLFNLSIIAAALISRRLAAPQWVLAWSVIVGGFLQMGILIPSMIRSGYFPRLTLKWETADIGRVMKAVLPGLMGLSVLQVTTIVNLHFASYLPQGTHTYLYLADRILELPLSLFVVSIGSALLPTLSQQWAEGDKTGMGETINHYVRLIVFVSLPAAVGMFVLAHPITEVLFLGREFKYEDALATAQVIQIYSFGLILAAGVRILSQGFYAIRNAWYPAVAAGVAVVSHVLFAYALTRSFGLMGLAGASVASSAVNLILLGLAYHSWVGSLELKRLLKSVFVFAIGAAVMVAVLSMYQRVLDVFGGRHVTKTFVLLLTIVCGALTYFAVAHILRVPEYKETVAGFMEKIRRKLGRRSA